MNPSRRNFIRTTALTGAFLPFTSAFPVDISKNNVKPPKIYFFTKLLDHYDSEFIAETLAMTGVDGFDLTVRPGGKVEPERVSDDLPKFAEIGKKYKLETGLMVTAISGAEEKYTESILKTASTTGVKHYRLGYYNYDYSQGIISSLESVKKNLEGLSVLNRKYNIQAGYQNHAGTRVGAPMWDLWELMKDLPVATVSSQFDIRHAVAEGSASWIIALHLLYKNIGSLAIKDFTWQVEEGKARMINVPLGTGIVDFNLFFKTVKDLNIDVPVSLHIEYPMLDKTQQNYSLTEQQKILVQKIKHDVQFIRENW